MERFKKMLADVGLENMIPHLSAMDNQYYSTGDRERIVRFWIDKGGNNESRHI